MVTPKYFERVRALASTRVDTHAFDFSALGKGGGLAASLVRSRTVHSLLRIFWPVGRVGRFGWVVRHADVAEVRGRTTEFIAPYGEEMIQLTGGANFVLGMEEGPDYRRQLSFMRAAIRPEDIPALIAPNARRLSEALVSGAGGEIDAVEDLLFRVAAETCADYFGLEIEDATEFSQWLMSLSALLFADYFGSAETHQLALAGAARIRRLIDNAIAKAHAIANGTWDLNEGPELRAARAHWYASTVIGRLVALGHSSADAGPSDDEIRAIVMGTAVGYVPTGGGAGGNILDVLLDRPVWLQRAHAAALAGEDGTLGRILAEAMRFAPPIDPGLPRYVTRDAKVRGVKFPAGATVLVAAKSAMFDGRVIDSPGDFNPDRDMSRDLQFGGDFLHWCFGEAIARVLLLETFKPLLRQNKLARAPGKAGRRVNVGPFPQHLGVRFEPALGHRHQAMVTICVPVTQPVRAEELNQEIAKLGNPASAAVRAALDACNRIQFAHISAIEGEHMSAGRRVSPACLVVEMTGDGDSAGVIEAFASALGVQLMPLFALSNGVGTQAELTALLRRHERRLVPGRTFPGPATASGVNFPGTPELSVTDIARDNAFAAEARAALDRHLASRAGRGGLATPALASVRAQLRAGPHRALLARAAGRDLAVTRRADRSLSDTLGSLAADPSVFGPLLLVLLATLSTHLLLDTRVHTTINDPAGLWQFLGVAGRAAVSLGAGAILAAGVFALMHGLGIGRRAADTDTLGQRFAKSGLTLGALTFILGVAHFVFIQNAIGIPGWDNATHLARLGLAARVGAEIASSLVVGLLIFLLLAATVIGGMLALLRTSEIDGAPQDIDPDHAAVKALLARENHPGHVQNHLVAVTQLKTNPRWLRRFTLGLAFWGIAKLVQHRFRPGFVLDIGTIHYARWFRLPGTDKLIFFSNYDGSWESYLEDFITKAHLGQTAVWSNGVGFPKTSFLLFDGASDGARFKRWVRRQQAQSLFWYTRFPELTTDQIRTNALVCEGLAKARTESEAQAWLDLFGSQPRPPHAMEHHEVQSIVFSGMGKLRSAELIPIRVPEGNRAWQDWLLGLIGGEGQATLRAPAQIAFGDAPPASTSLVLGLSAQGLKRFGMDRLTHATSGGGAGSTLDTFPEVFVDGMASPERARILGDQGPSNPATWSWSGEDAAPHAVLLLYAPDQEALATASRALKEQLAAGYGFTVLPSIRMEDLGTEKEELREPFGFRDGVSQPVIRGTRPVTGDSDAINVVEPGEFVLGYPDNRGDIPPSPVVAAGHDRGILPDLVGNLPGRFPEFDGKDTDARRDFGRNGSYLVIRQLEQDAAGFHAFVDRQAKVLQASTPDVQVTPEWVAAKLVGRWPDGSSLVRHPLAPAGDSRPDNDFLYGKEDPQGLRCPYGSHIRRAFPRDSLNPEDPAQMSISNRHRLLRRGRPYLAPDAPPGAKATGILFMCLNADIERQFEFVQQTWVSSPTFHGLAREPDPIASSHGGGLSASFTLPHSLGPMTMRGMQSFVTVRNGGYFFVPSWSAIRFLAMLPPPPLPQSR